MNKIAPLLTVFCLGLLLAWNWGLFPLFPPLESFPPPPPPVPPRPVLADPLPSISPAEAHALFLTELEIKVHDLINENRESLGLQPLARRSSSLLALLDPPPHCPLSLAAIPAVKAVGDSAKRKRKVRSNSTRPPRLEKDPRGRPGRRRTARGWAQNLGG